MAFSALNNDNTLNPDNIAAAQAITKLTSPVADEAAENHDSASKSLEMPSETGICSACMAAEMVELLYWMALLRGVPLAEITGANADISSAIEKISWAYSRA